MILKLNNNNKMMLVFRVKMFVLNRLSKFLIHKLGHTYFNSYLIKCKMHMLVLLEVNINGN